MTFSSIFPYFIFTFLSLSVFFFFFGENILGPAGQLVGEELVDTQRRWCRKGRR